MWCINKSFLGSGVTSSPGSVVGGVGVSVGIIVEIVGSKVVGSVVVVSSGGNVVGITVGGGRGATVGGTVPLPGG